MSRASGYGDQQRPQGRVGVGGVHQQSGADSADAGTAPAVVASSARRTRCRPPALMVRPATRDLIWAPVPSATIRPSASTTIRSATCVGLVEIVGGEQHGPAVGGEVLHRLPERAPDLHVHPDRRLVQDQQLRVGHDRQRVAQPLGLTAGELVGLGLQEAAQIRPLDDLRQAQRVGVQSVHQPQQVADGRVVQQRAGLQHRTDPTLANGQHRIASEHPDAPASGRIMPRIISLVVDLPAPFGPEHGDDLARCHGQVDAAYGVHVPI